MHGTTIAFDFGGTKIDICRMRSDGSFVSRDQIATATLGPGRPAFLDAAFDMIASRITDNDDKVGLSWNAPVHEGRLTQSSLLGGRIEVDLGAMLRERFAREVQVESDVHAMALGVHRFDAGSDLLPFIVINLGSGSGIAYHDGQLMRGSLGGAGLVSQETMWVDEIGEALIMDLLLSGRGVSLLYERLTGIIRPAVEIHALAAAEPAARRVFDLIGHYLGLFIVGLARLFNPRAFILCGSVARAAPLYLEATCAVVRTRAEPGCQPALIRVSELDAAACRGLI